MLRMEEVSKSYRRRGQRSWPPCDDATSRSRRAISWPWSARAAAARAPAARCWAGCSPRPRDGSVLEGTVALRPDRRTSVPGLRQQKIGFVFQTFNLVPYLTALENVQVPLYLAGWIERPQRSGPRPCWSASGWPTGLHHKPCELSVGQQQRVALARMLANDPALILADEPTGNLDPETGEQMIGFFEEFNREGRTIVMVTHDLRAAGRARRVVKLSQGTIFSDGDDFGETVPRAPTVRLGRHAGNGA